MDNNLKVLRAMRSITQDELSKKLHVSRQTINAIELGKFNPSVLTALKLARFFETTVEEVFFISREGNDEENY